MKRAKSKEAKITEKALYVSLFAMVVSCAMLFESTYAWFTQTVSTPVSVIQTGNMSAKLVVAGAEAALIDAGEGAELALVDAGENAETKENNLVFKEYIYDEATGSVTENTVFQPDHSYRLPAIYVQNTGNIDLSYTISLGHNPEVKESVYAETDDDVIITKEDGSTEVISLYDVLDFVAYVQVENGEYIEWDWANPIPLTVARGDGSTEGNAEAGSEADEESAAGNEATDVAETGENNSTERMVTGVLKAPEGDEPVVSRGFVIQATMKPEAGIEYSGLELSGLQIIVNTTQIIPDGE